MRRMFLAVPIFLLFLVAAAPSPYEETITFDPPIDAQVLRSTFPETWAGPLAITFDRDLDGGIHRTVPYPILEGDGKFPIDLERAYWAYQHDFLFEDGVPHPGREIVQAQPTWNCWERSDCPFTPVKTVSGFALPVELRKYGTSEFQLFGREGVMAYATFLAYHQPGLQAALWPAE